MCTAISYRKSDHYFGRNMDIDRTFGEKVTITPRNYLFHLENGQEYRTNYALYGMAVTAGRVPLYFEASNEKGLSAAGLNFPQNAYYQQPKEGMDNITPSEFIPWILGQAATVKEALVLLKKLNMAKPADPGAQSATLHYMLSDATESIVAEPVREGLKLYDNPYDVMTNNPPFEYHKWNIQKYLNLNPQNGENKFSRQYELKNYAQGLGAMGLPGDASSPSRLIRAAFHLTNSYSNDDEVSNVTQFFHVLDSVAMVKGATVTPTGDYDLTTYSCCMNTTKGIYYYKTYDNNQINAIHMHHVDLNSDQLITYELNTSQNIKDQN